MELVETKSRYATWAVSRESFRAPLVNMLELWGAQVSEGKLASTMIKGVLYNKLISHAVTKDEELRN